MESQSWEFKLQVSGEAEASFCLPSISLLSLNCPPGICAEDKALQFSTLLREQDSQSKSNLIFNPHSFQIPFSIPVKPNQVLHHCQVLIFINTHLLTWSINQISQLSHLSPCWFSMTPLASEVSLLRLRRETVFPVLAILVYRISSFEDLLCIMDFLLLFCPEPRGWLQREFCSLPFYESQWQACLLLYCLVCFLMVG